MLFDTLRLEVGSGYQLCGNVSSSAAVAFSAQYNFGFKNTIITGRWIEHLLLNFPRHRRR